MRIISYDDKYAEDVKDLLTQLQEYIASLDREKYNIVTDEYREKYFQKTMDEVNKYEGIIYLAVENDKAIGLIAGLINNEDEITYDFKAPKRGRVTELVVDSKYRGSGVGKALLEKMEEHFKDVGCYGVLIDVFGYNEKAQKFYFQNGYFTRNIEIMKKI